MREAVQVNEIAEAGGFERLLAEITIRTRKEAERSAKRAMWRALHGG
jgi:hypothetical protein